MAKAAATEHCEPKIHGEAYEQGVIAAWRNIPFKPSPPPKTEIDLAAVIRERLRLGGFDLKLGPDGSVLIVNTKGNRREPPPDLARKVWERVEAVGALLEQER